MPTHESYTPAEPIAHTTCPDTEALHGASNEGFESILREPINDGHSSSDEDHSDSSVAPVKLRPGGPLDDNSASETSASRSTTAEPEIKPEEYAYSTTTDFGFALTRDTALTFSDVTALRRRPAYPCSLLRPGSRFVGTQRDKEIYDVQVEIQQIDLAQSTICGYLTIDGLTKQFPSLTTFFEGEIVGPRYSFITEHATWGATERTDLEHWNRFPAFRPLTKKVKHSDYHPQNISQNENIFMRWKERFLVPDHKISEIQGASYEGFYYICFNQIHGRITGTYFHSKSDRFQSLDLKHVPDYGRMARIELA